MKDSPDILFEKFLKAATCKATLQTFRSLCKVLDISYPPQRGNSYEHITFYQRVKQALGQSWKAQSLFSKLDKRYTDEINFSKRKNSREGPERVAKDFNVLVIGAGPCGLRTAIFTALLGAKTVVVEKRDSFSRNNVLHLWPYTIEDLKGLGAKKFNGRFCSGAIDHVSIRQLQLILLKAALIFGVEIHVNTAFVNLNPPNSPENPAWTAKIDPDTSIVNKFKFDMIVGADGRKNTLKGFERKTFRGSLAIGITVNFINKRTTAEAKVEEISGISFIFRQHFFRELNRKHNIDLENIVYYKDDTHYFVMTARKQSLLERNVLKENLEDPKDLVSQKNIDSKALLEYALDAVNFSTENKLPDLEVAINSYGLPDIALFDFTCMKSSVNATMFLEVNGVKLLQGLVGDGLIEPFWPRGTGIAKGFLAAYDTSWMLRQWALGSAENKSKDTSLELSLLVERESIYRLLPQIESNTLVQNYSAYTLDPRSRYQNLPKKLSVGQVKGFYVTDNKECMAIQGQVETDGPSNPNGAGMSKLTRNVSFVRSNKLLNWCEKAVRDSGSDVLVKNMTSSWKDGRALCTIINYYRPDILSLDQIRDDDAEYNNQLSFDVANEQLGVTPIMSGKEMAECEKVDDLLMVTYLSQFYELFKNETPVKPISRVSDIFPTPKEDKLPVHNKKKSSPLAIITKVAMKVKRKKAQLRSVHEYDLNTAENKRRKTDLKGDGEVAGSNVGDVVLKKATQPEEVSEEKENAVVLRNSPKPGVRKNAANRISALGAQLISQFEQNSTSAASQSYGMTTKFSNSKVCYFCGKTVYIVERLSVEGLFFHRQCFKCSHCDTILSTLNYKRDNDSGKFYCAVHYFANAEYLKSQYCDKDKEISIPEAMEEGSDISSIRSSTLSPVLAEDPDRSIPTIEHGQVVMRKDLTPRRSDMAEMSMSIAANSFELEEEAIYEHNIRRSTTSEVEDEYYSSDSEFEELDDFVAKTPEFNGQTDKDKIDKILKEFQSQRKASQNGDSASMPSDEELSSISSTSEDDTRLMKQFLAEGSGSQSAYSSDEMKKLSTERNEDVMETGDDVSLSSVSSHDRDSLEQGDFVIKDKFLETDSLEVDVQGDAGKSAVKLKRKDTLEGAEKHIRENPIEKRKESLSSSNYEFEEASAPQQTSFCSEKKDPVADGNSSYSSSSSSDGMLASKDSLESAEDHMKRHPVSKKQSVLSSSSSSSTDLSSASSEGKADAKIDEAPSVNFTDQKLADDTSVWVDSMSEQTDFSSPPTVDPMVNTRETKVRRKLPNIQVIASTPRITPFTPTTGTPEIFATPCATSEREDTFYSVKSEQSSQDVSRYEVQKNTDQKPHKKLLKPDSFISEDGISETPRSKSRRKLPVIPHLEALSPQPSESLPTQSRQTGGRRRLPVIPMLEAMSSTAEQLSPRQRKRIDEKLQIHENRVMERMKNENPYLKKVLSPGSEDLSPKQRKRIDKKLKKHESRVMERIEKMKFGYQDSLPADNLSDKAQDERDEFAKYVPVLLQKRSNELRKRKPNNNRNHGFFTGAKKDISPQAASPKVMSPNNRLSRKKLSSYSSKELHRRVLKQAQVAAERQAKEEERKRMAKALVLQGQLQEVDIKRKQLEEQGVELEKLLRSQELQGVRSRDSSLHMHEWFKLVQQKNALLRYENELWIHQRDLQLEDEKSRLERDLRERLAVDESEKTKEDIAKEREIELKMQRCVDQRNELVMLLDEHRLQDREDNDIEKVLKDSLSSLDITTPL